MHTKLFNGFARTSQVSFFAKIETIAVASLIQQILLSNFGYILLFFFTDRVNNDSQNKYEPGNKFLPIGINRHDVY